MKEPGNHVNASVGKKTKMNIRFCLISLLIPCHMAMGQCAIQNILKGSDFPKFDQVMPVPKPWYTEGKVGILQGKARSDHTAGWNALRQSAPLQAKTGYALAAFVRTSKNMRDGYIGFRSAGLPKPVETKFGPHTDRTMVRIIFTPAQAGSYDVFIGFSALDKEAWMEVDAVRLELLSAGCGDVNTQPAH